MTYEPPHQAPPACRHPRCAHLDERVVMGEHRDRCRDNRPMHEPCAWKKTEEELRKAKCSLSSNN